MLQSLIAGFFRSVNSRLIATDNLVVEKVLKGFLGLSILVYRSQVNRKRMSREVVINNFDTNIKMKINPAKRIGSSIYWTGYHEFREFLFLHRFLKPDMVFIDAGANQGEYSLFAAKRLVNGIVMSFEPLTSVREMLSMNIALNGFQNIKVFDCGLSNKDDSLLLYESIGDNEGLGTLYPGNMSGMSSVEVRLKTLDEVFESSRLERLDFIKMDIEGAELNALQGASKVIQKCRPTLMVEINESSYRSAGYKIEDIQNLLKSWNYSAYSIERRGKLKRQDQLPLFGNVIFQPE